MNQIYLDNAATTCMDSRVIESMYEVMKQFYGNPSSIHQTGTVVRDIIEDSRRKVAHIFRVEPAEIFFTSGATESINAIIEGIVRSYNISRIITSKIEHPAVIETVAKMRNLFHVVVDYVDINEIGEINLDSLSKLLENNEKTLVCLMHANNELGNLLSIKKVGELCKSHNALFFSDTTQSVGKFDLDFSVIPVDFAVGSAHKFHGPKGVGFMYINNNSKIHPLIHGGPQERNMRAGTENLAGIIGLTHALELSINELNVNCERILSLKNHLVNQIEMLIPDALFLGDKNGLYTILNIGLPKINHNKMVIFNLDVKGFAVSGGSACSSGVMSISHVIKALGKSDDYIPIRVSLSKYNTIEEIDLFVEMLKNY